MAETKKRDYGKISILKLKSYAEKHTALFTAIFSALIAATTVYLQLCYYVYKYGQLSYFNIDVNTVRLVNDSNKFKYFILYSYFRCNVGNELFWILFL